MRPRKSQISFLCLRLLNNKMKAGLNLIEASELLANNETSSVELTNIYLDNIKKGEELNCYNTVSYEEALKEAESSDKRRKEKKSKGRFDGIPIGIKDLFCTKNIKTTASSKILSSFVPTYESTASQNCINACLLYTSPSPRDGLLSRMPSSA